MPSTIQNFWTVKRAAEHLQAPYTAVYSAVRDYGTIASTQLQDGTQVVTLESVRAWIAGDRTAKKPLPDDVTKQYAGAAYVSGKIGRVPSVLWGKNKSGALQEHRLGCGTVVFHVQECIGLFSQVDSVRRLLLGKSARVRQVLDALQGAEGRVKVIVNGKWHEAEVEISKKGVEITVNMGKELG